MSKIIKVVRHIHKHKKKTALLFVIIVALITATSLCIIIPKNKTQNKKTVSTNKQLIYKKTENNSVENLSLNAPTSGDLQYELVKTYYAGGSKAPRFIYYTPEFLDDRLIELNDLIIADLKQQGLIDENTKSYNIDYFNDKKVATIYFEKINDSKTSASEKLKLVGSYIAFMSFSKSPNVNQLFKISETQIIKKY